MSVKDLCAFYCLSFKNETRRSKMIKRFQHFDLSLNCYDGVSFDDERMQKLPPDFPYKKTFSYTYGHFDLVYKFYYETDKEYGVFCEDDVLLHKDFSNKLSKVIDEFKIMNLDLLLLGYLPHFKIEEYHGGFHLKHYFENNNYKYHNYPNELWGAQMYMLSRAHAKTLIDKYCGDYPDRALVDSSLVPFSSDWTITKDGNRALIYPMIAMEDGDTNYDDYSQQQFHQSVFLCNYIEDEFI